LILGKLVACGTQRASERFEAVTESVLCTFNLVDDGLLSFASKAGNFGRQISRSLAECPAGTLRLVLDRTAGCAGDFFQRRY
jgi:hypothetical protein